MKLHNAHVIAYRRYRVLQQALAYARVVEKGMNQTKRKG